MIKEFDTEAYARKWRGSLGIAEVDGQKRPVYYSDIVSYTLDDGDRCSVALLDSGSTLYAINKDTPQMKKVVPLYFPWESGVYVSNAFLTGFCLLWRYHRKSYTNGLYPGSNWHMISVDYESGGYDSNPRLSSLNFLTPLPKMEIREKGGGYLSKKFWYSEEKLYFLYSHVGMKKGKEFSVSETLAPVLKPLLDEECQIKVL